jgi:hypothetical protein
MNPTELTLFLLLMGALVLVGLIAADDDDNGPRCS